MTVRSLQKCNACKLIGNDQSNGWQEDWFAQGLSFQYRLTADLSMKRRLTRLINCAVVVGRATGDGGSSLISELLYPQNLKEEFHQMKKIKIVSAIAITLGLAIAGSASAASSGGTITFTGTVTDATCTVSGGAGTSGDSGNFSVALDEVAASALSAAGASANPKQFNVIIGGPGQGTCEDGKVASMTFLPSSIHVDAATGALKNALAGEATNTQFQLLDGGTAGTAINLAAGSYAATATIAANTATIPFGVQYLAVNGAATPGLVSSNVVYAVTYN